MLAGSHRNAWPDETGTGGRTNRNTQLVADRMNVEVENSVKDSLLNRLQVVFGD